VLVKVFSAAEERDNVSTLSLNKNCPVMGFFIFNYRVRED